MSYDARPEFDLQELVNEYGLGGVSSVRKAESCGPDDQPTILVAEFQDIQRPASTKASPQIFHAKCVSTGRT